MWPSPGIALDTADNPQPLGTAAPGSGPGASPWDHVHGAPAAPTYKKLGIGTATSNQACTTTADVTSVTATYTPDGTHPVITTYSFPGVNTAGGTGIVQMLKDGTNVMLTSVGGDVQPASGLYYDSAPSATSHTNKMQAASTSGGSLATMAGTPAQNNILVEQIG